MSLHQCRYVNQEQNDLVYAQNDQWRQVRLYEVAPRQVIRPVEIQKAECIELFESREHGGGRGNKKDDHYGDYVQEKSSKKEYASVRTTYVFP